MGTVRLFSSHVRWSDKEVDVVRSMYPAAASRDLLAALPGRSLSQIQNKANGIGVSREKVTPRTEQQTREAKRQYMAARRVTDREGQNAKAMAWYYAGHERNKATLREYYAKRFFGLGL